MLPIVNARVKSKIKHTKDKEKQNKLDYIVRGKQNTSEKYMIKYIYIYKII